MKLVFKEFKDEIEDLVGFLTSEAWEFYGVPNPKEERIRENYNNQFYTGEENKSFWITTEEDKKIGFIRVYDFQDSTPLIDIRISSNYKGQGIGTKALTWVVDYIFNNYHDKERIEGNTRRDNYGMRCVFYKCGFVKEAHYRNAWKDSNGKNYDAIGYGITREDWIKGEKSPVEWNDFKC